MFITNQIQTDAHHYYTRVEKQGNDFIAYIKTDDDDTDIFSFNTKQTSLIYAECYAVVSAIKSIVYQNTDASIFVSPPLYQLLGGVIRTKDVRLDSLIQVIWNLVTNHSTVFPVFSIEGVYEIPVRRIKFKVVNKLEI